MRIKLAIIILAVVGATVAANLLIHDASMTPLQLDEVRTACPACHSLVPAYDAAITVHNSHPALNCSRCHSYISGLKATDSARTGLERLGAGATLLALTGIVTNFFVVNRRGGGK